MSKILIQIFCFFLNFCFGFQFRYTSKIDYVYVALGVLGALIAGVNWPILTVLFGFVVELFALFERGRIDNGFNQTMTGDEFMQKVYVYSAFTFGNFALLTIGNFMTIYYFQLFALRYMRNVKQLYFDSILKQEIAWYDKQSSGEFASRISR